MRLNHSRILLGGFLAGLAMNTVDGFVNGILLGDQYREIMRRVHAEHLIGPSTAFWIGMDFLYAFAMSYLGAAMRSTFGPGIGSYLRAGIAVWLVGYLTAGWDIIVGVLPLAFHAVGTAATLIGFAAGAAIASRIYRDAPSDLMTRSRS